MYDTDAIAIYMAAGIFDRYLTVWHMYWELRSKNAYSKIIEKHIDRDDTSSEEFNQYSTSNMDSHTDSTICHGRKYCVGYYRRHYDVSTKY